MVFRCFTEKRSGFDIEAQRLYRRLHGALPGLTGLRLLHRYDVEGMGESAWAQSLSTVFADPLVEHCFPQIPPLSEAHGRLVAEALPGEPDLRGEAVAEALQAMYGGARPRVAHATVYLLLGTLTETDLAQAKELLIDPRVRRDTPHSSSDVLAAEAPRGPVRSGTVEALIWAPEEGLEGILRDYGLEMALTDLRRLQEHFRVEEQRDPTAEELRIIDAYWAKRRARQVMWASFGSVEIEDEAVRSAFERHDPKCLADIAALGTKADRQSGLYVDDLVLTVQNTPRPGLGYPMQMMRIFGFGDPRSAGEQGEVQTLPDLSTGLVHALYHPGYEAKPLAATAVLAANAARHGGEARLIPGDRVLLIGAGGGDVAERRGLTRLFQSPDLTQMIRRKTQRNTGALMVDLAAIADGFAIHLEAVPKEGGAMLIIVPAGDAGTWIDAATAENVAAVDLGKITREHRWIARRDEGVLVDLPASFLHIDSASDPISISVPPLAESAADRLGGTVAERLLETVTDLRHCSQRGLGERFDGTLGAKTILAPYGGKTQRSPAQAMAVRLPGSGSGAPRGAVMTFGSNPRSMERNPFRGAEDAVVDAVAKLVASGVDPDAVYLSVQADFPSFEEAEADQQIAFLALLGALEASRGLGLTALSPVEDISTGVPDPAAPPTLMAFALGAAPVDQILSSEFQSAGNPVYYFPPGESLGIKRAMWSAVHRAMAAGRIKSARAVTGGGVAEAIFKLALGKEIGFSGDEALTIPLLFTRRPGGIVVEAKEELDEGIRLGETTLDPALIMCGERVELNALTSLWTGVLAEVYPQSRGEADLVPPISQTGRSTRSPAVQAFRPRAVIPLFPGTFGEEDLARALYRAGGEPKFVVIRNLTADSLAQSVADLTRALAESQMLLLPGGTVDSATFAAALFRQPGLTEAVSGLLDTRGGLIFGVGSGCVALLRLGLLPHGEIRPPAADSPVFTTNSIGHHQARFVTTRVASVHSPWMRDLRVGDLHTLPVSHGMGRFVAEPGTIQALTRSGQIATQYCDSQGRPLMHGEANPFGSTMAIEGLFSPDGRVFGKMAHAERYLPQLWQNVAGNLQQPIFENGVSYFK